MKKLLLVVLTSIVSGWTFGQKIEVLVTDKKVSMRGLSVVSDDIIWVSGSGGTVGRSTDAGKTWNWMTVPGYEKTDFRDIEAFDAKTAVIMGIESPAYILRTTDGGASWTKVYENSGKGMFLDAMMFWNVNAGMVIGDPIDDRVFMARSFDGGKTWTDLPQQYLPTAAKGEAFFASSGSNIAALSKKEAVFVSGGLQSRLFVRDQKISLPLLQGKESTGANAVDIKKNGRNAVIIVVGGDFNEKNDTTKNCCITNDNGKTFLFPTVTPHGYRSGISYLQKNNWICCGLNGVDYSTDNGMNWTLISPTGFHVCKKAKKGKAVYLAGNGRIGRLVL